MKCTFCKQQMIKGTGKMFVKNDGRISYFCSSKCEKNSKIRDPKHVTWVIRKKKQRNKSKHVT